MLIAQMTDLHMVAPPKRAYGRVDTWQGLHDAVRHLRTVFPQPDALILSGDIADGGLAEEYECVRGALDATTIPTFIVPGNHDDRDAMRRIFCGHRYLPQTGYLQYVVPDMPIRLIGLDTLSPGQSYGELCRDRLDWLDTQLAEADKPVVLFMHHPPAPSGHHAIDQMCLRIGAECLADIILRHANVERIICGHVHRPITFRWAGTVVCVAPSIAHQATLDLASGAELTYTMEPPAIGLHQWMPQTGLVSHLSFVGRFSGPHPFH